jgi:Phage integrase family
MITVTKYPSKAHWDGRWICRWDEWYTIPDNDGKTHRRRKMKGRVYATKAEAEALRGRIQAAHAKDETYLPERDRPTVTLDTLALGFVAAARDRPLSSQRVRSSKIDAFLRFAGKDTVASDLSVSTLRRYAATLPYDGRKADTRHRKVQEVEKMWEWGWRNRADYPGVPEPEHITGRYGEIQPPPRVVALATPTWGDLDRVIGHLEGWQKRLAIVLRYTGFRVSQGLNLRWSDIHFDEGYIEVRADVPGAKGHSTRALPLHAALAEELAGWGRREGYIFSKPDGRPRRGNTPVKPFRRAWKAAEVPGERWDAPPEGMRAHGRPTHAFRAAMRVGLLRRGVEEAAVLYMIGHTQGVTARAYVPEATPLESPWWQRCVEAMVLVPRIGEAEQEKRTGQVIPLPAAGPR